MQFLLTFSLYTCVLVAIVIYVINLFDVFVNIRTFELAKRAQRSTVDKKI